MKKLILPSLILVLYGGSSLKVQADEIVMSPGEVINIPAPPGQSLKVSNSKVVRLVDQGSKVNLFALKAGEAFVYVGSKSYSVNVVQTEQGAFYKNLQLGLKERMGLSANSDAGVITITGELYRWSDWEWISELAQKYQTQFQLQVKMEPEIKPEALKYISQKLLEHSLATAQIQWGPPVVATISSKLKDQLPVYQKVLGTLGIKVEVRENQLALMPSVQVEVVMAELTERLDRQFGLEWSPFGEFQVLPTANFKTSLGATLRALETRGLGKILATPRILCRSGSEAEFHSGGEFPIPITEYQSHYKSQNIVWKKHGIVLKFKPQADLQGRMSIKIYAELSVLSDQSAGGVPAVLINKIESEFDLSKPQTVALSGLIRQDWHRSRSGLPWISQIPVLNSLFSSENFLNRKSELVVFVTPKIISETPASVDMPKGWQRDSL